MVCRRCKAQMIGREPICGTCEIQELREHVAILRTGLEQVRNHHIGINNVVGRPVTQSRTIQICDDALSRVIV